MARSVALVCFGGPADGNTSSPLPMLPGQRYEITTRLANGARVTATYEIATLQTGEGALFESRLVLKWVPYPERDKEAG